MLDFSNYYTLPKPKKEERHLQRLFSNNNGAMGIGTIVVLVLLVVLILASWWWLGLPPSCNPNNQVELTGVLMGFEKNQSFSQYWDVKINSEYFAFDYFQRDYMTRMIGKNVTITCCLKTRNYKPYSIYSALNCYICGESDT